MKKIKFLSIILSILTIFLLAGCNSDEKESYIEQLEELDRSDLASLNSWLDDNEDNMEELFEIVHIRVDFEGNELDFISQVLGLDIYYFDSWSFEVDDDTITFTYRWDYESATVVPEPEEVEPEEDEPEEVVPGEVVDPFAADNEILASWIGDDLIPLFEDIDVEGVLMFTATTGGIIHGVRSTMEDSNASEYLSTQVEIVISFIEEIQTLVVENFDNDDLDLVEVRDIVIETLTEMRSLFVD